MTQKFLAAAAQIAPAFLDLEGCLDIARKWIEKAGEDGVRVLVFPETWLPGYPVWLDYSPQAALWDHSPAKEVFGRLMENSPTMNSPALQRLCAAAAQAGLNLVMGINERDGNTLYNTMVYISEKGQILGKHRKLIPTYSERLVWGRGDGSTLAVVDTSCGRLGGLVCWEHWMPLARQAMHDKHELLHTAVWPAVKELHQLASRSYAFEGRCFVIAAGSILDRSHLPDDLSLLNEMPGEGPWLTGGSVIIGPDAKILVGPVDNKETLVIAEIDPGASTRESMTLDVSGHYSRPDIFRLAVNEEPQSG